MSKMIDQRAQRHDPASLRTHDPDARPDSQTKQPGSLPADAEDAPLPDADGKANTRDSGKGGRHADGT